MVVLFIGPEICLGSNFKMEPQIHKRNVIIYVVYQVSLGFLVSLLTAKQAVVSCGNFKYFSCPKSISFFCLKVENWIICTYEKCYSDWASCIYIFSNICIYIFCTIKKEVQLSDISVCTESFLYCMLFFIVYQYT